MIYSTAGNIYSKKVTTKQNSENKHDNSKNRNSTL